VLAIQNTLVVTVVVVVQIIIPVVVVELVAPLALVLPETTGLLQPQIEAAGVAARLTGALLVARVQIRLVGLAALLRGVLEALGPPALLLQRREQTVAAAVAVIPFHTQELKALLGLY
jgi:hypothetical protein